MVLDRHRGFLDPVLDPWTHVFRKVPPNVITWISFPFALAAGLLFYYSDPTSYPERWFILPAAFFVMINGMLDLLDGRVARMTGKMTPLGDFLDHTMDRFADVVILTGLSLSPWGAPRIGLVAIVVTLLSSYIGTQAQAVGAGRLYGGILARADRMVLLMGLPLIDLYLAHAGKTIGFLPQDWFPGTEYSLGWLLYYIAIAGTITVLERFVRVLLFLRAKQPNA
ncbi:MAG TPA: CDP-alcohol phosphatidyltransferase family protein [Candidatus Thermoplasmatota archaeon]|nr:CDP-alcohol phosphatidyltransferase family protein [Candidatus Thermoplasmatota archaeon]